MILIFGKTGQVAIELQELLPDALFFGRGEADLTDPAACAALIEQNNPEAVINAAAYTAVDKAESDEATAALVNGAAPTAMAGACATLGIPFIHISTDYVFDGTGTEPFKPDDKTAPLGAYGRTKLAGEDGVRAARGTYAILRTSWVFSPHGSNFVKTMLRLSETRTELGVVADQIGGPTPAAAIAQACIIVAKALSDNPEKSGTYHFSGSPSVSWAGFAREIFAQSSRDVSVSDIPTSAYPTPALRPINGRMDFAKTESAFGIGQPDWKESLQNIINRMDLPR